MRKKIPGPVWVKIQQRSHVFTSHLTQVFNSRYVYYSLQSTAKTETGWVGRYKKNLKGQPE